jgi:predicted RNA-binding Zn-ribbon protein involved in translation (DUF1610 family)
MFKNREKVNPYRCPECFAKEIDIMLRYDQKENEYYCQKCCYTGQEDDILHFYEMLQCQKFPLMFVPHPWQKQ